MSKPTKIIEESDRLLSIEWSDEKTSGYNAAQLRKACPCATCVNEWTGEKILRDESVVDDLSFSSISIVGNYALGFQFSDGHGTGIYSFQYLKKL